MGSAPSLQLVDCMSSLLCSSILGCFEFFVRFIVLSGMVLSSWKMWVSFPEEKPLWRTYICTCPPPENEIKICAIWCIFEPRFCSVKVSKQNQNLDSQFFVSMWKWYVYFTWNTDWNQGFCGRFPPLVNWAVGVWSALQLVPVIGYAMDAGDSMCNRRPSSVGACDQLSNCACRTTFLYTHLL